MVRCTPGPVDLLLVQALEAVPQHRTVLLTQQVGTNVNDAPGSHPQEQAVEGCVMDLAEGEAIRHYRVSGGVLVGDDVGGIEQRFPAQPAESTPFPIGVENPVPENPLMDARQRRSGRVAAFQLTIPRTGK